MKEISKKEIISQEKERLTMKNFMAQVRKHNQRGTEFYITGCHYNINGFVRQLKQQGFDIICILEPKKVDKIDEFN